LDSGAHLTSLRRTRVGDYRVEDAFTIDSFEEWLNHQEVVNELP
ncbi:MAG: tRNA pseudouridine(55) synthase, partial [Prevotella sp.]|nr:tRNA pseudouridine(55) synthase [Prevotella sp.]